MSKVFNALVYLLTVLVVVQFFLAGRGSATAAFEAHRVLGFLIVLLGLAAGVVAALGGAPTSARKLAGALVLLLVLQPFIAGLGHGLIQLENSPTAGGVVFGLHAVNGLLIVATLATILVRSRKAKRAVEAAPVGGARS